MKKKLLLLFLVIAVCLPLVAQKYYTKNGNISFFSATSLENIKANNNQVMSVLNAATGELQFSVLIRNFHFNKALMEEHFNENYLESDKYPKAGFKGIISDFSHISLNRDGSYPVSVVGELMIHGISKNFSVTGTIKISEGKISATSVFKISLPDFNISIPKLVENNISKNIEITINCVYDQQL